MCVCVCVCVYSLRGVRQTLLLVFCTMRAWLFRVMLMMEGLSLHGSPSTCIGMGLKVVSSTSLH